MRAAERYAELEAAGLERPRCECHGEAMVWGCKKTSLAGGCWLCRVRRQENCRRWREANPELTLELDRKYKATHKDKIRAYYRLYYEKNRERELERARQFRLSNPGYATVSSRRWREENPERYRESMRTRQRVMIGGQRFSVPDKDFKEFAIALREERRRHQTEGATQNG